MFTNISTSVLGKYMDIKNYFLFNLAIKLLEHAKINTHAIHSIKMIELKLLQTYIETNLTNRFIKSFKSPTKIVILFIKKFDRSFLLLVDYYGPNN